MSLLHFVLQTSREKSIAVPVGLRLSH